MSTCPVSQTTPEGMTMFKVKFINPDKPGAGFIDGYRTARRAKEVVDAYNAQFAKDGNKGVRAEYLGRDKPPTGRLFGWR